MTRGTAQVLIGGPALVERALGEKLNKEELGGAQVHLRSGVVDNVADDEADVLAQIRRFLSYLPSNVWERAPRRRVRRPARPPRGGAARRSCRASARRAYKMRRIVELVVDRDSFFELTPGYGRTQITGLARLAGQPVGVLANDCVYDGGAMTAEGAQKLRRFVEICDAFHLPIVCCGRAGLHDRHRGRARRHHPLRHGGDLRGAADERAVARCRAAQVLRRRRRVSTTARAARWSRGRRRRAARCRSRAASRWPSAARSPQSPDPEARRRELEEEYARRAVDLPARGGLRRPRPDRPAPHAAACSATGSTRSSRSFASSAGRAATR